jgi:ABC-type branched-subunit amino acid transport system substrate-binding protein
MKRWAVKIVAFETYTTNDKDFSAQLTKIKDAKPDVIFLPNYYSEVPLASATSQAAGHQCSLSSAAIPGAVTNC